MGKDGRSSSQGTSMFSDSESQEEKLSDKCSGKIQLRKTNVKIKDRFFKSSLKRLIMKPEKEGDGRR